jgi:alcohol dehydrogenase
MMAVVYHGAGDLRLEEVPEPVLRESGDVLVRVTAASICGSDLLILHGRLPGIEPGTIVGHEFTGVVDEVGPGVQTFKPGDRVLGPAAVWCGECRACRRGLPSACERSAIFGCGARFGDLPGAQAELVRVPQAGLVLHPIPRSLSDEQVILAGDILPTAYSALLGFAALGAGASLGLASAGTGPRSAEAEAGPRPGDTVVVLGAGPVGLCAVAAARLFEPEHIVAVDLEDYRLEVAASLGALRTVNASREEVRSVIRDLTYGWGADLVVEAAGSQETLRVALACAAPGGTVAVAAVFDRPVELPLPRMTNRSIRLTAGLGNLAHMPQLVELIEAGRLDLTPLITHRLPLDQALEGYQIFEQRLDGVVKVVLQP